MYHKHTHLSIVSHLLQNQTINPHLPLLLHCFSRPLPSLESPQPEFLTPTEELAVPLRQEEIPPPEQAVEKTTEIRLLNLVKEPLDLPESLKITAEFPESTQQTVEPTETTQTAKGEFPKETDEVGLSDPTKKKEHSPEELPEPKIEPVTSSEVAEEAAELLEPTQSTEKFPEPPITTKTAAGPQEPRKLVCELPEQSPEESPLNVPAEEPAAIESVQDPAEEPQDSG